jgi:hypothetical protein
VHDLENTGDTELIFATGVFLDSANKPLPVPDSVRVQRITPASGGCRRKDSIGLVRVADAPEWPTAAQTGRRLSAISSRRRRFANRRSVAIVGKAEILCAV